MATTDAAPGLSFPRDTFASLTPKPFLLAHLKLPTPSRPSGRSPPEFRKPTVNTGSLSHSNGSAVVRVGDTAVVCGVRAEILLATDIARPPEGHADDNELVQRLGLLVPNVELSTGCSPAHLPGNPPGSIAQSLSYRVSALLNASNAVSLDDLRIKYNQPVIDDETSAGTGEAVTKAYWTLYIDILCLALDGNALDAVWLAVYAALHDTRLPGARWDPDRENVVCSTLASNACPLQLHDLPIVTSFAVFTTASPLTKLESSQTWLLADPDAFEEEICEEALSIVLQQRKDGGQHILKLDSSGGVCLSRKTMGSALQLAESRCEQLRRIMDGQQS
ncbi:Putative ribosomal protein S5 domain 2-type [Septoria linicola]|uniref:Ribosomal RNA-processing protein 43 n=1 Tax=Septoria linicola TaxID=215465 RepID=A0A9Q9AKA0_9PEZI|nr:putative ribosomal protein S5 domain 2-type [Septoria linicola]USW47698.1 Putative ribosomal protein S5 domain 2-type [Septoria linicola]